MRVSLIFRSMPGDLQVQRVDLRIDTEDLVLALTKALSFAEAISTIPIQTIVLQRIPHA